MVYKTVEGRLVEDDALDTLSAVRDERRELLAQINRDRWDRYQSREPLFEFKYGAKYPNKEWQLPCGDQFNIVQENANYGWAPALFEVIQTGDTSNIHADSNLSAYTPEPEALPTFEYQFIHLRPEDFELDGQELQVYSATGETLFSIQLTEPIEGSNLDFLRIEYENAPSVDVYYEYAGEYDNDTNTEASLNKLKSEFNKTIQAAYAVVAASGALEVMQIEAPAGDDEFVELFEQLELHYVFLGEHSGRDIYLVSHTRRGRDIMSAYKDCDTHSVLDYSLLLGYPKEISRFVSESSEKFTRESYDRYSSEEFVVYLIEDGDLTPSDAHYFEFCPYRSPPTKQEARYAVQLGKQIEASVEEFCRLHDRLEQGEVLNALKNHKTTHQTSPRRDIFPSDYWPINEDSEVTESTENWEPESN